MRKIVLILILSVLFLGKNMMLSADAQSLYRTVGKEFKIQEKECTLLALQLEKYLLPHFFTSYDQVIERKDSMSMKFTKHLLKNVDKKLTSNATFCYAMYYLTALEVDGLDQAPLKIIELGFKTEQEAKALCDWVKENKLLCLGGWPVSSVAFRAYQYGKQVVMVATNDYKKFDLMDKWKPESNK